MVSADGSSQSFGGLTAQIGWFGLRVGGHPALSLHSSNEPGELSQCHDDSTINIVVVIIIIIIIIQHSWTSHSLAQVSRARLFFGEALYSVYSFWMKKLKWFISVQASVASCTLCSKRWLRQCQPIRLGNWPLSCACTYYIFVWEL